VESAERMAHLLEEIELADRVGLASYGIREHHRVEYYDAAPAVILAAAAARTSRSNAAVRQRALRRAGHPGVAGRGGSFMAVLTHLRCRAAPGAGRMARSSSARSRSRRDRGRPQVRRVGEAAST
jgi:hypothetical protein